MTCIIPLGYRETNFMPAMSSECDVETIERNPETRVKGKSQIGDDQEQNTDLERA